MPRGLNDILAGLIFVGFGLAFAATSATYQIGSAGQMGPGAFPLILGLILGSLGAGTMVKGWLAVEPSPLGSVPWKALFLLSGAIVVFGVGVRGLGLAPALVLTVLLAAVASHRTGLVLGTVIAIGLTIVCVLVFVVALGLRLSLVGPWLGGV